jgi:cation:H+ antiporter
MLVVQLAAMIGGLALLVWSADRFVSGATEIAGHLGLPPLVIGMVIVGFGTSAPELAVSAQAALQGAPGIALGNAYGSNIANIALILGLTAVISPITVQSQVLRRELPLLCCATLLAAWQLMDGLVSRFDAALLLLVFSALMGWTSWRGCQETDDTLGVEMEQALSAPPAAVKQSVVKVSLGLIVLLASSRLLIWGAVGLASGFGVSNLVIGLTIVAIGTSLPELASSIAAARRQQHDLALGNILGSNLFNTLAVVGLAGVLHPVPAAPVVLQRDVAVMGALSLSLFVLGYGFRGQAGRINRREGVFLCLCYVVYSVSLMASP